MRWPRLKVARCWLHCILAGAIGASSFGVAAEPRVPFQNDVVVYDPGTHERGLPGIEFLENESGTQVDIARTLHVHRFYYNGDREFQFSLIQGGPTTVVTTHPRTGEKLYIDVDLPSGVPVIAYNKHSITYVFPDRRVIINFPMWVCTPTVNTVLIKGRGPLRNLRDHAAARHARVQAAHARNPLALALKDTGASVKQTAVGTVGVVSAVTGGTINRVRGTVEQLPIISQVRQAADQHAEQGERLAIDRVTRVNERAEDRFLPTNR